MPWAFDEVAAGRAAGLVRLVPDAVGRGVVARPADPGASRSSASGARRAGPAGSARSPRPRSARWRGRRPARRRWRASFRRSRMGPRTSAEAARADEDRDLLRPRRGADEEAGLEGLGVVPPLEAAMQTMAPTDKRRDVVGRAGPAEDQEDQAGEQQRGDGHARDRVRRRADLAGQARRDRDEEEAEEDDQDRAEQVHVQRSGRARISATRARHADDHQLHRQVVLGARHGRGGASPGVPPRSRRGRPGCRARSWAASGTG